MKTKKPLTADYEQALTNYRYSSSLSQRELRLARLTDVALLAIIEGLDRRIARLEEGR